MIGNDAFQECDTTGITRPCTKHNYLVKDVNNLARTVHEAFYVARSGRPGPVVIDLPKDVQFATGPYTPPDSVAHKTYRPRLDADLSVIDRAIDMLAAADRPIIYGGGGIINSGDEASTLLREFAKLTNFPVTLTLMGLGAFPASDKQFLGMLGMHGTYESNLAMHGCDVMFNIGARFDDRVTGRLNAFSPNSKKIHLDIDPSSINKTVMVDLPVIGDVKTVLKALIARWKERGVKARDITPWWGQITEWRKRDSLRFGTNGTIIKPQHAIRRLWELSQGRETFVTTEVGQHQMWAAQHFGFESPRHWMTSGGLGTMGYGLPSAMGVQIAHPDALVVDISGEASAMMNIQEMSTLVQYRLPVKVFILNNQYMGMVRQWQELLHGGRYSESYSEALPDFVKLAEAFGARGLRATDTGNLDEVLREMIAHPGPVIADICVDQKENCFPMIPSGAAHNEMLLGPEDKADPVATEEGMVLV